MVNTIVHFDIAADNMPPFDDVIEIYAVFKETDNFGGARNPQLNVMVGGSH